MCPSVSVHCSLSVSIRSFDFFSYGFVISAFVMGSFRLRNGISLSPAVFISAHVYHVNSNDTLVSVGLPADAMPSLCLRMLESPLVSTVQSLRSRLLQVSCSSQTTLSLPSQRQCSITFLLRSFQPQPQQQHTYTHRPLNQPTSSFHLHLNLHIFFACMCFFVLILLLFTRYKNQEPTAPRTRPIPILHLVPQLVSIPASALSTLCCFRLISPSVLRFTSF